MKQLTLEAICPYVREVGLQHNDSWKNQYRRIFDHQFLYCFTGVAHMIIGEKQYRITNGDLIIIPPNTPHQLWIDEEQPGEMYWFHCDFVLLPDREWLYDFYNTMEKYITLFSPEMPHKEHIRENPVFAGGYSLPHVIAIAPKESMEYCFRSMYKTYLSGDRLWQLRAKRLFLEILEPVLNEIMGKPSPSAGRTYVVNIMKSHIAKHYFEPLTVAMIARDTGLNTEYASKVFRHETGMKLVEYINYYRVNQSKKLLIDPDLSLADIAEMVGFSNENYFSAVLKKLEGKTPGKLRAHLMALVQEDHIGIV